MKKISGETERGYQEQRLIFSMAFIKGVPLAYSNKSKSIRIAFKINMIPMRAKMYKQSLS